MPRKRNNKKISKDGKNLLIKKPDTEQQLFVLQLIYSTTHDEAIWQKFYLVLYNYVNSLILQLNVGRTFVDGETINQKTSLATSKFIENYKKDPNFSIQASFAGHLKYKAMEVLWGTKKEDVHLSLNSLIGDSTKELEDGAEALNFQQLGSGYVQDSLSIEDEFTKENAYDKVEEMLKEFDEVIKNPKLRVLLRFYLLIEMRGPKTKHVRDFFYDNYLKTREKILFKTVRLEFYNRILKNSKYEENNINNSNSNNKEKEAI
jgi:hypothetical protein